MGSWLAGIVIIGGTTIGALGGMYAVRKYVHADVLRAHHDVAGYMLTIVAGLYAILLGLVVVNVQTKLEQAKDMAQSESNACKTIWHLTRALPHDQKDSVRDPLYQYVLSVQNENWFDTATHQTKELTIPHYQRLWGAITQLEPKNGKEEATYSALLTTMTQLSDARRFRMIAGDAGVSPVLWAVLIIGGILSISFTFFFHVERMWSQAIMTAFVAIFLSLNIFLVYLYNNPYRDELEAKSAAFNFDPELFDYLKIEAKGEEDSPAKSAEDPSAKAMPGSSIEMQSSAKESALMNPAARQSTEMRTADKYSTKTQPEETLPFEKVPDQPSQAKNQDAN